MQRKIKQLLLTIVFILIACISTSCLTSQDDPDVDQMPWNTPSSWEGTGGFSLPY